METRSQTCKINGIVIIKTVLRGIDGETIALVNAGI